MNVADYVLKACISLYAIVGNITGTLNMIIQKIIEQVLIEGSGLILCSIITLYDTTSFFNMADLFTNIVQQ